MAPRDSLISSIMGPEPQKEEEVLNYLKMLSIDYKNNEPQKMLNTIQVFLKDKGDSEERIKNMCVMNKIVMPYIIQHYGQENKNIETTVTVYNKLNEQQSHWYNYFYGIIFGIEKAQGIKLKPEQLKEIKDILNGLCVQFAKKTGGKLMTGGMAWQLIPLIILAAGSLVNGQGFSRPSDNKFDQSALSSHLTGTDMAEVGLHAGNIFGHLGVAIAGSIAGEPQIAVTALASLATTEVPALGFSAFKSWSGLTEREQRENYGKITNEVATQFREFIQSGKAIVTEDALITTVLDEKFNTKIIKVGDKVIEKGSSDYKAIRNCVRFVNAISELQVYDKESQTYMAEHRRFSRQSAQPVGDGEGALANMGIGDGKQVTFDTMAEPFREFVSNIETERDIVLKNAGLTTNDIEEISRFNNEFGELYWGSEISISEDTLNIMTRLNDVMYEDRNMLNLFQNDRFFDATKKHWSGFKSKIDDIELNAGKNLWWLALQTTGGIFLAYTCIKYGKGLGGLFSSSKPNENSGDSKSQNTKKETKKETEKEKKSFFSWLFSKKAAAATSASPRLGGRSRTRTSIHNIGVRKTKSKKNKRRKTKKNHKRRNNKHVK